MRARRAPISLLVRAGAAAAVVALSLAAGTATAAPAATRAASWAPAATATIHPGVQTRTAGAQCTSNFVFTDGSNTYLGQAAHCAATGAVTETNGCTAGSLPIGTPVTIEGASKPGTLVYSSWLTMQSQHETDPNACAYNDLGLVKIDPADVAKVNPSVPTFGGPVGLGGPTSLGEIVYSYGNSELRLGLSLLSPKTGISLGDAGAGWTHQVLTLTPGIPGDSGSAFLDSRGRAIGVLSTLQILPIPASNDVSDLAHMLDYLHSHTSFTGVQLANGTQPFRGSLLGLLPLG